MTCIKEERVRSDDLNTIHAHYYLCCKLKGFVVHLHGFACFNGGLQLLAIDVHQMCGNYFIYLFLQ